MPQTYPPAVLGVMTTVAALAVGGALVVPSVATAAPKRGAVVLAPAPGERIAKGPVRIAVRAGRERRDLRATLNGVPIGAELRRFGRSLRRLPVSHSHGLRHGVNVLKVEAHLRGVTRRATVRFRLQRRAPLAGAGRDMRAVVGVPTRLRGRFASHRRSVARRSGASRSALGRVVRPRVRWTIVKAPAASRLLRRRRAAGRRGGRASAAQSAAGPLQLPDDSLVSGFTPDALGRYVVRMTAEHPDGTASDTVAIDVVPRSAMVFVDTAIDGADPQGTTSYGRPADAAKRSGIRVGDVVYRVPWMQANGGVGSDVGTVPGTSTRYSMGWQILVFDRRTLALVDNRVYGLCTGLTGSDDEVGCRPGPDGRLMPADLHADLLAYGPERLVIAALQPLRGSSNGLKEGVRPLAAIGFPDGNDPMWRGDAMTSGSIVGVGVPTLPEDAARVSYVSHGRARMWGYLSADDTNHFGFVPGSREQFDTRASATCDQGATGSCTITQTIGDQTLRGSLAKGTSGYLVSVHDRWTLALRGTRTFATGAPNGGQAVRDMADYLNATDVAEGVVMITSLTTPGKAVTTDPTTSAADWKWLAEAIASVGGTRHRFNSAASTLNADYSLIGWTDAGEGNGDEIAVGGARLRGALVPDRHSQITPVNVSADGPSAEQLQQLIVRQPVNRWPLDDDPGARAALAWIGSQVPQLGPHPRSAYWLKGTTFNFAAMFETIQGLEPPGDADFSQQDFVAARRQLLLELGWVSQVRWYLGQLSQPYLTTIQDAFPASSTLADRLEAELDVDRQQAAFSADWFDLVESLLMIAGGFEGVLGEEAEKIANVVIETSAGAMEMSDFGYQANFDGASPSVDDDRRVRADELARALAEDARASVAALERMGNAIVSDPTKLAEVGRWGGCNSGGQACAAGYEEYGLEEGDVTQANALAALGLERALYGQLVTRSFPVWDTGLARDPRPYERFICTGGYSLNSPFDGNPDLAAAKSLEELDPSGAVTRWRTSIAVTRNWWIYSWPSATVLHRMFDPVNVVDMDEGGLGLSPQDVYREAEISYEPGVDCGWMYLATSPGGTPTLVDEPQ